MLSRERHIKANISLYFLHGDIHLIFFSRGKSLRRAPTGLRVTSGVCRGGPVRFESLAPELLSRYGGRMFFFDTHGGVILPLLRIKSPSYQPEPFGGR